MHYLVQKEMFKHSDYVRFVEFLERFNISHTLIDYKDLDTVEVPYNTFCYGSVSMARRSKELGLNPGSFFGINLDYEIIKDKYKENLLNYDSEIVLHHEVKEFKGEKFMRPALDSKSFNGGIYTYYDYLSILEKLNSKFEQPIKIQISNLKEIYKEARIWIVKGKVVESAYYRMSQYLSHADTVDPILIEFAQEMADLYCPSDAFVMDVCNTSEGLRIVELNCINCAGFYNINFFKLMEALEDAFHINE